MDAPVMANPFEYRTHLYEAFFIGDIKSAPRDTAKEELEALLASGVGGSKLGMGGLKVPEALPPGSATG